MFIHSADLISQGYLCHCVYFSQSWVRSGSLGPGRGPHAFQGAACHPEGLGVQGMLTVHCPHRPQLPGAQTQQAGSHGQRRVSLSLTFTHSLTHSFIHSLIQSLTHHSSYIHSFINSFTHSITHLFTPSLTPSLPHSLTHLVIHSFAHSLTHLATHSLTHLFTPLLYSFTYSLIH